MNTATITAAAATTTESAFARALRKFWAELRRAFELSGAPYVNGPMPPL